MDSDQELGRLLAELIVEAGRDQANPAMLEVQRLQLELASVDRQIQQARGRDGSDVSAMAQRRAQGGLGSAMAVTLMLALIVAIVALFAFARSREARTR